MSSVEILFCRENLDKFGAEVWQRLTDAKRPELRLQLTKCIIACGECSSSLIARVNGQLIAAENADRLIVAIDQQVQQFSESQQ